MDVTIILEGWIQTRRVQYLRESLCQKDGHFVVEGLKSLVDFRTMRRAFAVFYPQLRFAAYVFPKGVIAAPCQEPWGTSAHQ